MINDKYSTTLKILFGALLIMAIAMLVPLGISIYNHEGNCTRAFGIVALACAIFGFAGYILTPKANYKLKTRDGFIVMMLLWIFVPIVGAVPYALSGEFSSFVDSYFESISGFTTTGASVVTNVEALPFSILFWRSLSQWIGGLGFLMIIAAIFPIPGQLPNKGLLMVYSLFTICEIILLKVTGFNLFESITTSFATISTGGFTTYNDNIVHFANMPMSLVIISIFMVISAINILPLYSLKRRDIKKVFKNEEVKFFLLLLLFVAIALGLINWISHSSTFFKSVFTTISIITTTGFEIENYTRWPLFSQLVLILLFIIGACTYSSGGGLKAKNVLVGSKLIIRSFKLKIHTNRFERITLSDKEMSNDEVIEVTNFIFAYIGMIFVGILLLSLGNQDFTTTITSTISCLGNVGPGFGNVSSTLGYASFNDISKLACGFLMILGRLEIFPFLALFSRHFWNTNKL